MTSHIAQIDDAHEHHVPGHGIYPATWAVEDVHCDIIVPYHVMISARSYDDEAAQNTVVDTFCRAAAEAGLSEFATVDFKDLEFGPLKRRAEDDEVDSLFYPGVKGIEI